MKHFAVTTFVLIFTALICFQIAAFAPTPAYAVEPDEILDDPVLEKRARSISKNLRCLVCQNQSIDDSNADLARDLRILVRERLVAGDSDDEVINFAVARYGDYVLLKPPFKLATYGLWFGPLAIFLLGAVAVFFFLRRHRSGGLVPSVAAPSSVLSAEEERKLKNILDNTGSTPGDGDNT